MEMVRLVKGREQYVDSEDVMFNESPQALDRSWVRKSYKLQFSRISRGGDLRASVIAGLTFLG
jgi:hypothetical protein